MGPCTSSRTVASVGHVRTTVMVLMEAVARQRWPWPAGLSGSRQTFGAKRGSATEAGRKGAVERSQEAGGAMASYKWAAVVIFHLRCAHEKLSQAANTVN